MKIKEEKALAGMDVVIAIIAVSIFSTLIFSMMYSNVMENVKLKKETLAMIYITEIFENIAIANYEDVNEANINNLIPTEASNNFDIQISITNQLNGVSNSEDIIKKVTVTLKYNVANKTYSCSMQRMKSRE